MPGQRLSQAHPVWMDQLPAGGGNYSCAGNSLWDTRGHWAGLGNVISDILKGFISPASVSGFLGNFFAFALIPGMIVRDASLKNKNSWMQYIVGICIGAGFGMLSMPWFIDVTGTMPPVAAWTTGPFALLMNRILSPLLLGPVFLKILYPFTVKNGMYWRQENTTTVENL